MLFLVSCFVLVNLRSKLNKWRRLTGIEVDRSMAMARFETEKFNGRNDFGLWRIKMKALLIHQGLDEALESTATKEEESTDKQKEIMKKARNAIILNLDDKVLREVAREESTAAIWKKLEELYMTKSLANRLYLKQRLYSFKFVDDKAIGDQLDQFNKIVDDLENVDAKMEEEDKAIALLNALPKSFEQLRDAMLYGREKAITLVEVQSALKSKDLQRSGGGQNDASAEILNVKKFKNKFKPKAGGSKNSQDKEKGDKKETRSCHYCKKPGHIKKNCFSWKRKQAAEGTDQGSTDVVSGRAVDACYAYCGRRDGRKLDC